ncbi:hypothetical protein AB0C33_01395 [Nonomuraea sp. NPDC048881]|uniref:hypothetical protein n=1 Tax=Nonomuraea sp. NPDC048881 TaxID=3155030 RepID=UPI003406BD9D
MGAGENSAASLGLSPAGLGGATIRFTDKKISKLGSDIADQEPGMGKIETNTKGINIESPGFGVVGLGLSYAHEQIKNGAGDTVAMARSVLKDYKTALEQLEKNYEKVDKDNDGLIKEYGDGPPPGGGIDPSKLGGGPGGGLPPMNLPDDKLSDKKFPDDKLQDYKLPDDKLSDKKFPDDKLPDDKFPDNKLPDNKLPDNKLPDSNLPDPNAINANLPKTPSIEDQLNHNTDVPDLKSTLPDPSQTKLSGLDPNALNSAIPSTGNLTGRPIDFPTSGGFGGSSGSGGTTTGAGAAAAGGLRGAGAAGMSGMPFMPMSGGAAGNEQNREREKPEYVRGDENDWLDDMDIAPPVLGE